MEEVKLLGHWNSPFSYRVLWGLKHMGIKFWFVEEDLFNKSELLLRYNPIHKKILVLVHGGKPIAESIVILEYMEEIWPQNPLLSLDSYQRTMARFWIRFGEDKAPTFYKFFHTVGEEQVKATKEFKEILKVIEENGLGEKKFFGDDQIGLTDIAYGWIACWLDVLAEAAGVELLEKESFLRSHISAENFKEVPLIKNNLPNRDKMLTYFKFRRANYFISNFLGAGELLCFCNSRQHMKLLIGKSLVSS